jgi:hypothetical protein
MCRRAASNGMLLALHFEKISLISVILICYLESERDWCGRCGGKVEEVVGGIRRSSSCLLSVSLQGRSPKTHSTIWKARRWRHMFSFFLRCSGINTFYFNRQVKKRAYSLIVLQVIRK